MRQIRGRRPDSVEVEPSQPVRQRGAVVGTVLLSAVALLAGVAADSSPCSGGADLTLAGSTVEMAYDAPAEPLTAGTPVRVEIDLSELAMREGLLVATATWSNQLNDYDLVIDGEGPFDWVLTDPATGMGQERIEKVVEHCQVVNLSVDNVVAVDAVDEVAVTLELLPVDVVSRPVGGPCPGPADFTLDAASFELLYDAPAEPMTAGSPVTLAVDLAKLGWQEASLIATAHWTNPLNDYELLVDGEGPRQSSLLGGGMVQEKLELVVQDCQVITTSVDNYLAVDQLDGVRLTFELRHAHCPAGDVTAHRGETVDLQYPTPAMPMENGPEVRVLVMLEEPDDVARVTVTASWERSTSDYDLVVDGEWVGSGLLSLTTSEAGEVVVRGCRIVTVQLDNAKASGTLDPATVLVQVG